MNATLYYGGEEDELAYEFSARRQVTPAGERIGLASVRNLTGQERASQQARYRRGAAPTRTSGMRCRGNKRHAA